MPSVHAISRYTLADNECAQPRKLKPMLAITHLVVSLLLIQVLMLDRNDSFVALTFGVFIDIDHLFGLKDYVAVHGIAGLVDFDSLMNADGQWKSMMHTPAAVMIVGPVATASRLALPLLFWGVHIMMDYAEDAFLGVFSIWEIAILCSASVALVWLGFVRHRISDPESGLAGFLRSEWTRLTRPFGSFRRAASRLRGQ